MLSLVIYLTNYNGICSRHFLHTFFFSFIELLLFDKYCYNFSLSILCICSIANFTSLYISYIALPQGINFFLRWTLFSYPVRRPSSFCAHLFVLFICAVLRVYVMSLKEKEAFHWKLNRIEYLYTHTHTHFILSFSRSSFPLFVFFVFLFLKEYNMSLMKLNFTLFQLTIFILK